jgi:NUMOD3 motif
MGVGGRFEQGQVPWNKGITGGASHSFGRVQTPEARAKMSAARKGSVFTPEHREKLAAAKRGVKQSAETVAKRIMRGERHGNWKGDQAGYEALHAWVRLRLGNPSRCEHCGTTKPRHYEWANVSGKYKRQLSDWIRLCKPCHSKFDGTPERRGLSRRIRNG